MRRTNIKVYAIVISLVILCGSIGIITLNLQNRNDLPSNQGFDKPAKYNEYFQGISVPIRDSGPGYETNYRLREFKKAKKAVQQLKSTPQQLDWVERGPGNVGGRTRALVVDPDDPTNNTWFAGSASGGIWKTTDGGQTWTCLTDDFPTLATVSLVMAPSDHDILYVGTGEGFSIFPGVVGNGIFKSVNRGNTWDQLPSTTSASFEYVNKLAIDPNDENIVLACTDEGIYKTLDGGITWDTVFQSGLRVQDIAPNPNNFDTLYAAVNTLGIIKSSDAGDSWDYAYSGMGSAARFSVAVSPVNTRWIYALAEAQDDKTDVYVSSDAATTWNKFRDASNSFIDFLGSQGYYNNVIKAHPYNENEAFVGGVSLGKVRFSDQVSLSDSLVVRVDTAGTGSFLGFINFGGAHLGGGMSTGDLEDGIQIEKSDWSSVEIRFGPEKKQKACRFTVPVGMGPGVDPALYSFHDYIEVPFEVWDTDRNRQLMVSFRDQERDSVFNLIERDPDNDLTGREYIFVQAVPYDPVTPDTNIAKDGGHVYKQLYFYWPTLAENGVWVPDSLPGSEIIVTYGAFRLQDAYTTVISSVYDEVNTDLHVDHHELIILPTDPGNGDFTILNANDGGLGVSYDKGDSWEQITDGYVTTQFYGVAKKVGSHQYIGGMQDNGTWQSPDGETAIGTTPYTFRVGGDGFATIWNSASPARIIASSQFNHFVLSGDGGSTWQNATDGLDNDGPFFSRLGYNPLESGRLFTVGGNGIYRSTRFGRGLITAPAWELISPGSTWYSENLGNTYYNVEVSIADPDIVWAGAAMFRDPDLDIFVSTDGGENYSTTQIYEGENMGVITGIASHPVNPNEAYLLFSYSGSPKILRTQDLGQTWTDITGFEDSDVSTNGFPDVMVFSVLVLPINNNVIWAGTEIGLFESIDNGLTWHYADNGLPAVAIWDMFAQDGHIVLATHGRGIWTVDMATMEVGVEEDREPLELNVYPNPVRDAVTIQLENGYTGDITIQILDVRGSLYQQLTLTKPSVYWEETLDLKGAASGQYYILVNCGTRMYQARVVKI